MKTSSWNVKCEITSSICIWILFHVQTLMWENLLQLQVAIWNLNLGCIWSSICAFVLNLKSLIFLVKVWKSWNKLFPSHFFLHVIMLNVSQMVGKRRRNHLHHLWKFKSGSFSLRGVFCSCVIWNYEWLKENLVKLESCNFVSPSRLHYFNIHGHEKLHVIFSFHIHVGG